MVLSDVTRHPLVADRQQANHGKHGAFLFWTSSGLFAVHRAVYILFGRGASSSRTLKAQVTSVNRESGKVVDRWQLGWTSEGDDVATFGVV